MAETADGSVEFETPTGTAYGVAEIFPLNGGEPVACLVVQPESGHPPTRVLFDSPEADKLRKRHPELANVKAPAADAAQQAKAANAAASMSDDQLAAELARRRAAPADNSGRIDQRGYVAPADNSGRIDQRAYVAPASSDLQAMKRDQAVADRNAAQYELDAAEAEMPRNDAKVAQATAKLTAATAAADAAERIAG